MPFGPGLDLVGIVMGPIRYSWRSELRLMMSEYVASGCDWN